MRDQAALDPYTFVREAWRQKYDIFDGNPPTEDDNFDQIRRRIRYWSAQSILMCSQRASLQFGLYDVNNGP